MSVIDAVNRMQQIEARLAQFSDPTAAAARSAAASSAGSSATSACGGAGATGAAFASTLAAASGAKVTPAAGQLADNGTTGADIVADARSYLGVPYVFGGTTRAGLDCSGLVQRVYGDLGISLPRLVSGQSTIGVSVPSLADAQPGDLIVCNGGEHVVIYAGDGKIIQAPEPGRTVEERDNWISPSNVVTIRRIVPSASPGGGSSLAGLLGGSGGSSLAGLLGTSGASSLAGLLGSGADSGLAALLAQARAGRII